MTTAAEVQAKLEELFDGPSSSDAPAIDPWTDPEVVVAPGDERRLTLGGCLARVVKWNFRRRTWTHAVAESDLSPGTRLLLLTLAGLMVGRASPVVAAVETVADRAGVSRRTVQRHARAAAEAGFLRTVQRADADGCTRAPAWVPGIPEDMADRFADRLPRDEDEGHEESPEKNAGGSEYRSLGQHPKTGREVFVARSQRGPFVAMRRQFKGIRTRDLPDSEDLAAIDLERAVGYLDAKVRSRAPDGWGWRMRHDDDDLSHIPRG